MGRNQLLTNARPHRGLVGVHRYGLGWQKADNIVFLKDPRLSADKVTGADGNGGMHCNAAGTCVVEGTYKFVPFDMDSTPPASPQYKLGIGCVADDGNGRIVSRLTRSLLDAGTK